MDDNKQRENGRHKHDPYKLLQSQWMIPPHLMKDPHALTMKFRTILADRDTVIQERNLALFEKKATLAERDMAILQQDQAIFERNSAMMEQNNALAALEYQGNSSVNSNSAPTYPLGCPVPRGTKHMHHQQHLHHHSPHMAISSNKRALKPSRKVGKRGCKDLNRCSDPWRRHNLGLNHVYFDESSMPAPICSCRGVLHQGYKWEKGEWQFSCCTSTLSMYPLPAVPNKRHS